MTIKAGLEDSQAGLFSFAFDGEAVSFSCKKDKGAWEFLWTFDHEPEADHIEETLRIVAKEIPLESGACQNYKVEDVTGRDWLAESYKALPPFSVGRFFIYGSHYEGPAEEGKIPLLIEAATAFGSGEHGTTAACIRAIEYVQASGFAPKNILDMGCGSGILAACAAKLWPTLPVFAADNDAECVRVTNNHLKSNNIFNVTSFVSEGYDPDSIVWKTAPYDFIIANILAGPLIEMAGEQSKALADDGYLILSGTLTELADEVSGAYEAQGLSRIELFPQDEWTTILMRKNA